MIQRQPSCRQTSVPCSHRAHKEAGPSSPPPRSVAPARSAGGGRRASVRDAAAPAGCARRRVPPRLRAREPLRRIRAPRPANNRAAIQTSGGTASCGSGCEAHHGGGAASASLLAADSDPRPLLRRDELAAHGGGASATATDGASPAMHAERSDLSPLVVAQEGQRIDGAPSRGDDEPRMEGRTTVVATLAGGERVGTA